MGFPDKIRCIKTVFLCMYILFLHNLPSLIKEHCLPVDRLIIYWYHNRGVDLTVEFKTILLPEISSYNTQTWGLYLDLDWYHHLIYNHRVPLIIINVIIIVFTINKINFTLRNLHSFFLERHIIMYNLVFIIFIVFLFSTAGLGVKDRMMSICLNQW